MFGDKNQEVVVGNDNKVSLPIVQQIYTDLTGKNEKITKWFHKPYQIDFVDFRRLHEQTLQHFSQFNHTSLDCSIKVYYFDDSTDNFSSFEKFALLHANSNSPTERIVFTFNILIIHPETLKPQSYQMQVNFDSPLVERKKELEFDKDGYPFIARHHSYVHVEYIDYNVARTLMSFIEKWYESLNEVKMNRVMQFFQTHAHSIPATLSFILTLMILLSFYNHSYFSTNANVFDSLIILIAATLTASKVGWIIGRKACKAVNHFCPLTYVKLNKGDEKIIEETSKNNKKSISKFFLQISLDFLVGIAGSIFVSKVLFIQ